jgi:hypothetical protein
MLSETKGFFNLHSSIPASPGWVYPERRQQGLHSTAKAGREQ